MENRPVWFLKIENSHQIGIGECAPLSGLSLDNLDQMDSKLTWVCHNIDLGLTELIENTRSFPSIQMGLEMAFLGLNSNSPVDLFPSKFQTNCSPIKINGLIWMGTPSFMRQQIEEKMSEGYDCLKLKIGAIDWQEELNLLKGIREVYSSEQIELRVDANGAFGKQDAIGKLQQLSRLDIHSIEQPVSPLNSELLTELCNISPVPIALDESLIGYYSKSEKRDLLDSVRPKYIILKPSLLGGFAQSDEWIEIADEFKIGWWITSALESNVGLNAIAQWAFKKRNPLPQGLGTGGLFLNNLDSPLQVKEGRLFYNGTKEWDFNQII
jgi:o-succinylbenzoate synthase